MPSMPTLASGAGPIACLSRWRQRWALATGLWACALCVHSQPLPEPSALPTPQTARQPKDVSVHGDRRIDPYFWLRERKNPAVLEHLKAENAHAQAWFAPLSGLRQSLYDEMLARIQEDDEAVPYRKNGWWYLTRTVKGQAYPVHLRRRGSPDGPEQTLLDLNELAKGKAFLQSGAMAVSPDNRWLAYSLDETGALDFTLRIKNLDTGQELSFQRQKTDGVAWSADSRTLFYVTKDAAQRAATVWRHTLGQAGPDTRVYHERNGTFWLSLSKTLDQRYLVLASHSKDTSELRVIDAQRPTGRPRVLLPRQKGREASLAHGNGVFYLLVNDTGPNFRLVSLAAADAWAPAARAAAGGVLSRARELVAHRSDAMLEDLEVFSRHLVLTERERGLQKLRIRDLATGQSRHVPFDEPVYAAHGQRNAEFDTDSFRFEFSSLVTPNSVIDVDMPSLALTLKKRQPVLGGFDPARYASQQIEAVAPDGTRVPVSLVWRRDRREPGRAQPLLLEGYGAYGIPNDVYFSSTRLSLLDRGVVVALAHVRGGTDLGRTWYDQGKLQHKMNSFTDFVACAQALVDQGWTSPQQLISEGGSAGGLLVAAASNLRPDLFGAVVAEVPFVDVINTMLDETLPLTVGEFLEWGNPKKKADYAVIRAYSPYDNLRAAAYPRFFLRASLNDSQVPYWEAAKYAARLRELKTDAHPVLLVVNLDAGHGGASGRYEALRERAETLTFMLAHWGLAGR